MEYLGRDRGPPVVTPPQKIRLYFSRTRFHVWAFPSEDVDCDGFFHGYECTGREDHSRSSCPNPSLWSHQLSRTDDIETVFFGDPWVLDHGPDATVLLPVLDRG